MGAQIALKKMSNAETDQKGEADIFMCSIEWHPIYSESIASPYLSCILEKIP
tara:strand:+ start:50 stop:205 length:156 start_codon:yes stop_codon:yes gene_type:complete